MDSSFSTVRESIVSAGSERAYLIHEPVKKQPAAAASAVEPGAALVVAFHGGYASPTHMQKLTGLDALADEYGFIVVYPEGLNRHWNDGRGDARHSNEVRAGSRFSYGDDVRFVQDLIDHLHGDHNIDKKRIYATGISNGGMFCYRVAAELSALFAAIAPVAGGMGADTAANFAPAHPVSVLHIHGTADTYVPYAGGPLLEGRLPGTVVSAERSVEMWVEKDECQAGAAITELPASSPDDLCRVTVATRGGGIDGTEVVLYRITDGGHTWPNMKMQTNEALGRVCRDFDATATIWRFFSAHPKK